MLKYFKFTKTFYSVILLYCVFSGDIVSQFENICLLEIFICTRKFMEQEVFIDNMSSVGKLKSVLTVS